MRAELGLTQQELGAVVGVSAAAVAQWETGKTRPGFRSLHVIEQELGWSAKWVKTGRGERRTSPVDRSSHGSSPVVGTDVPVIAWATVAVVSRDKMLSPATMAVDWRACQVPHGPRTYYVEITDDSMMSFVPREKTYPPGCFVAVDPDAEEPESGKPVMARLPDGSITCRLLMKDAGRRYLRAINDAYLPLIDVPFEVVGTIKLKQEDP